MHAWGSDLGAIGDVFTLEGEIGGGVPVRQESMAEGWAALFCAMTGCRGTTSSTRRSRQISASACSARNPQIEWEREADSEGLDGNASYVLHFFSPEITIADPDNKDLELVLRLHHRSGIFGLMDGITSGSTIITTGIRVRF